MAPGSPSSSDPLPVRIVPLQTSDRGWVEQWTRTHWGDDHVVYGDAVIYPADLPGFIALLGADRVGLITYRLLDTTCEIITLASIRGGCGIGTALFTTVVELARSSRCRSVTLITTNDNTPALRFYQRRGMRMVAIHVDAVTTARALKPAIPLLGLHGIPIRDEIELALQLEG